MKITVPRIQPRASLLLVTLAILIVGLLLPGPILADSPTLEVLQVGWDGQVVPGSWSPVRVRLTGDSADLSGQIEVVTKARSQNNPQSTSIEYALGAYGQDVALPAGTVKEITIWVPSASSVGSNNSSPGDVRLVVENVVVAETRVEFRSAKTPYWPLMGVLADSPNIARSLAQIELPLQGLPIPLSVASLSAADLPPSAERLGALSALVVQGNAATNLTGEQRTALQQWVTAGGHLLLSGGPDASRVASVLPSGALPVNYAGASSSTDISALGAWAEFKDQPLATGPAALFHAEQGSLLAGNTESPLAWRFGLGQGTVTLLAVDLGLEPMANWSGMPALLRKALEPAVPTVEEIENKARYGQMQRRTPVDLLQGAVEALPSQAWPNWQTVALLLGGFVLVVGPGLHIVLWRTDRRILSWAIVPIAAVLLAGGMYFFGVARDGRDTLVNIVSYVQLDPNGGPARQAMMAGFFAPTLATLAVDVPGDDPVQTNVSGGYSTFTRFGVSASGETEPPFRIISGRDTKVEFNSGQWGMRGVAVSRWLDDIGGITANLRLEEGLIKGTIQNNTPYLLEDAGVLVAQSAAKLGSLAPGQTTSIALDPGPPSNPFGNHYPISWRLFGQPQGTASSGSSRGVAVAVPAAPVPYPGLSSKVSYAVGGMPEQLELPQDAEVQRRVRLMDPIIGNQPYGPSGLSVPLTFVAFTQAPVGETLPDAAEHPTFHLALLEQPLSLEMTPGPFTIPPALNAPEIISQSGGYGGGSSGTFTWVEIHGGTMVYQFRPPLPTNASVDALAITTRQMGQATDINNIKRMGPPTDMMPGPAEAGLFSIYNWQSAKWEPLPAGAEEARLQPASPYIASDGMVRIQVSTDQDKVVMFLQPELTVEGTVTE